MNLKLRVHIITCRYFDLLHEHLVLYLYIYFNQTKEASPTENIIGGRVDISKSKYFAGV